MASFFINCHCKHICICKYKYIFKYNQEIMYNIIFMYVHDDHLVLGNQLVCSFLRKNTSNFIQFPVDLCIGLRPLEIFFLLHLACSLLSSSFSSYLVGHFPETLCVYLFMFLRDTIIERKPLLPVSKQFSTFLPQCQFVYNDFSGSNKRQNIASVLPIPSHLNLF